MTCPGTLATAACRRLHMLISISGKDRHLSLFFYGSKKNPSSALAKRSGGNDKRRRISSTVFTESECVLFSSWLITRILLRWKWQLSWEHFRSHELNSNLLPPFDVSYTWWRKKETTTVSRLWIMDHYGSTSNINTAVAPRRRFLETIFKLMMESPFLKTNLSRRTNRMFTSFF